MLEFSVNVHVELLPAESQGPPTAAQLPGVPVFVKVIDVPTGNSVSQVLDVPVAVESKTEQLTPEGLLMSVPLAGLNPLMQFVRSRVYLRQPECAATVVVRSAVMAKSAVTVVSESKVTTQVPVPEHGLPHPTNTEPDAAVAVRSMTLPSANVMEQVDGQMMPEGVLMTVPLPVSVSDTVRVCEVDGTHVRVTTLLPSAVS